MGRKKIKDTEKKKRVVLYIKGKYIEKIKKLVTKIINDYERISNPEKD